MCFIKLDIDQEATKATSSIYALKMLVKEKGQLISPYRKAIWTIGKKKRSTKFKSLVYKYNIDHGLHCFRSVDAAVKGTILNSSRKLFLVEIPKGAMYYQNDTEICANQMIVLKEIKLPK